MSTLSDVVSFADACARGASDTQLLTLGSAIVKAARELSEGQVLIARQDALLLAGAQLLAAKTVERDALYARCPVLESDITLDHTATAIETFALSSGWTEAWRDENWIGIDHGDEGYCIDRLNRPEHVALFCNLHADLTSTPPLDVLKAISEAAEYRAKTRDETRDETRIRLAQLEEDNAGLLSIVREVVQALGGACDDAPIDIAKARMREYRVMVQCAEANEAEAKRYRARCPVLASDVGPEHTSGRVLALALANGWHRLGSTWGVEYAPAGSPTDCRDVPRFCNRHAKASGMAPLDVLDAIGAMSARVI